MSKENYVRIIGTSKYDANGITLRNGQRKLTFTLLVPIAEGARPLYVDCVALGEELIDRQLDGFVNKGEKFEVEGHLAFQTRTDHNGNVRTGLIVEAESVTAL